jgi:hypothetical protein
VTGEQERRRKQLLGNLKEKRGYRKFKQEALDPSLLSTPSGRCCGPIVRETRINEYHSCEITVIHKKLYFKI